MLKIMGLFPLTFVLSLAALSAFGAEALPKELVGEWRFEDKSGQLILVLRADGLGGLMGIVGAGGVASYDPERKEVSLSIRHDRTGQEVSKATWKFDPKAKTLTQEKNGKLVPYRKYSDEVPEPFKSADLNRILKPGSK